MPNAPKLASLEAVKSFSVALLGATLTLLVPGVAQATGSNDAFSAALPLADGQEISADNLEATSEPGEPDPTGHGTADACEPAALDSSPECSSSVWYRFQAPASTEYTIETCDRGTDVDSILGVYTGASVGSLAVVKENDDSCPGGYGSQGSRVSFMATAGTIYHVDVNGYGAEQGSFYLRAYAGSPQPRPQPDTLIHRESSFPDQELANRGVLSGPRHSASFDLGSTPPGASFECSLDGAAFSACGSPVSYAGLEPGSTHAFAARATLAGATDPTPIVERFTIDTTPPETAFTSGTFGETALQEGEWLATSSERQFHSAGFLCGIDGYPSFGCSKQENQTDLCQGPHVFRTAATDRAANVDPSPATASFTVGAGPACAPPTLGSMTPSGIGSTRIDEIEFPYDDMGAGGTLHLAYGKTTAYDRVGSDQTAGPSSGGGNDYFSLFALEPDTTYHYRVTLTTPFGSADSGDQTVKTKALEGGTIPVIENGTPVASQHAARVPMTIDPEGPSTAYGILLSTGTPVGDGAAFIEADDSTPPGSDPLALAINVVDLDPATTYHYVVFARQSLGNEAHGPEGTFTTPPLAVPISGVAAKKRFKLRRKLIRIGKLTRRSKKLIVRLHGLPAKTKVKLRLKAGRVKQTARKRAKTNGRLTFKLVLSKRVRKAIRRPKLKRVKLIFTASPPDQGASRLKLSKRIQGARRHRSHR